MLAFKCPRWSSGFVPAFLFGLLFLFHTGDARLLRIASKAAAEVVEVIHRRLQTTGAPYCIALTSANETQLQNALNWACGSGSGQGNVDCSAIQQGGTCYDPNSLTNHASYAFDQYYVSQQGSTGSCSFGGVATTSSTNPSSGSCTYPALGSSTGNSNSTGNSTGSGTGLSSPPPPSSFGISPISTSNPTASGAHRSAVRLPWALTFYSIVVMVFLS